METAIEGDFICVAIGQRTDGKKGDILIGIGMQLDNKGYETGKILIRTQLGRDGRIFEGEFDLAHFIPLRHAAIEATDRAIEVEHIAFSKALTRRR